MELLYLQNKVEIIVRHTDYDPKIRKNLSRHVYTIDVLKFKNSVAVISSFPVKMKLYLQKLYKCAFRLLLLTGRDLQLIFRLK